MKPRRWAECLQPLEDMRANVALALEFRSTAADDWWETDKVRRMALLHAVQVVGEAARRVPAPVRDLAPNIPWSRIVGIRNFIVHEYDQLDPAILKEVIEVGFPALLPHLSELLETVKARGDAPLS